MSEDLYVGGHLESWEFFRFAERGFEGCSWDWIEHHLIHCKDCLRKLDLLMLAESIATCEQADPDELGEPPFVQPPLSVKRDS